MVGEEPGKDQRIEKPAAIGNGPKREEETGFGTEVFNVAESINNRARESTRTPEFKPETPSRMPTSADEVITSDELGMLQSGQASSVEEIRRKRREDEATYRPPEFKPESKPNPKSTSRPDSTTGYAEELRNFANSGNSARGLPAQKTPSRMPTSADEVITSDELRMIRSGRALSVEEIRRKKREDEDTYHKRHKPLRYERDKSWWELL